MTNLIINRTDPSVEIISLATAKSQLRVEDTFTEEDDLIKSYINAAIEASENYIDGFIYPRSVIFNLSAFQDRFIFEAFPFNAVTSVKYWTNDVQTTMPSTDYYILSQNLKQSVLVFKNKPAVDDRFDAVEIEISVGYENAEEVPGPIRQAILLQISDMYERREDRAGVILTAAQALMRPYRKYT